MGTHTQGKAVETDGRSLTLRRASDRDADVGGLERRGVVDAVAGHTDLVVGAGVRVDHLLQRVDDQELVLRQDLRTRPFFKFT